jgi:DNA invertase Pin-like site-specific DNA recombinase
VLGYARVSTREQANGYGLDAQRAEQERWCGANGAELVAFHVDVITTRRTDRMIGRESAVQATEAGAADALLVRAIDRASRSVLDGAALIEASQASGVRLISCDGYDSADEETQLTANIKVAVAQEERRLISRRTREGLARAKAAGITLGRQSTVPPDVVRRIVAARSRDRTYATIAAELDKAGIPTPGGSPSWRPAAVRGICLRAG